MKKLIKILVICTFFMSSCATKTIDLTDEFNSIKNFFQNAKDKNIEAKKDGENWDLNILDTASEIDLLTIEEQNIILELNKVRSDPQKYSELYLVPLRNRYTGKNYMDNGVTIITQEGITALEECIRVLKNSRSSEILYFNEDLYYMAKDQVDKQGKTKQTGHNSPNGDSFLNRVTIWSNGINYVGENISYGQSTAREIIIQLLIDDGVPSRGHRKNILNPDYNLSGDSIGRHIQYRNMCVIDFGKI